MIFWVQGPVHACPGVSVQRLLDPGGPVAAPPGRNPVLPSTSYSYYFEIPCQSLQYNFSHPWLPHLLEVGDKGEKGVSNGLPFSQQKSLAWICPFIPNLLIERLKLGYQEQPGKADAKGAQSRNSDGPKFVSCPVAWLWLIVIMSESCCMSIEHQLTIFLIEFAVRNHYRYEFRWSIQILQ